MHHTLLPTSEDNPTHCDLTSFLEQVIYPVPLVPWTEAKEETTDDLTADDLQDPKPWTPVWEADLSRTASIRTFELCKHRSWTEWYHEFVVLTITYEGQDYLIHFNRAWAAPDGWRQYIPPITWGSQKPSNDEVAIYRRGKWERAARHNTYVVASFDFSWEPLATAYRELKGLWSHHPEYSLIGANCWAFSRSLAWTILYKHHRAPVSNGFIMGSPGPASRDDLLLFLSSGGPWALINSGNEVRKGALYRRLVNQVDFILEALLYGSKFYRHIRGDSDAVSTLLIRKVTIFQREKELLVSSSGDIKEWASAATYSANEIPHSFGPSGIAYDDPAVPPINTSCHAGGFLYILTPPLIPPAEPAVPRFRVAVYVGTGEKGHDRDTGEPAPWLECGLVRRDCRGETPRIVCCRTLQAFEDPEMSRVVNFDGSLEEFRPNDMMGVWVRGPPADVSQWSMRVRLAGICIHWTNVFRESRCLPSRASPRDLPGDSPHAAAAAAAAATSLWDIWPFNGSRSRLEFGRVKAINVVPFSSTVSTNEGKVDCTWSGVPHSFNRCGLAFDLEVPMYPTTLCQPGDFLYLLTPPIHFTPKKHVLSVTVYTWGCPFRHDKPMVSPPLSMEAGVVRSTARGELEPIGPRYEVSTVDLPPVVVDRESVVIIRHRRRMDDNHAFVRNLKAGDMIGLWVRARDRHSGYVVVRSLIVVETGPEVGVVGRYTRFVYEEIREVVLKIEVPSWAPAVGAVGLAGALFVGFSRAFRHS